MCVSSPRLRVARLGISQPPTPTPRIEVKLHFDDVKKPMPRRRGENARRYIRSLVRTQHPTHIPVGIHAYKVINILLGVERGSHG